MCGAVGLASLYRALAVRQMGIVAPVSAVLAAAIPVLFGVLTEGLPGATALVGFGLALPASGCLLARAQQLAGAAGWGWRCWPAVVSAAFLFCWIALAQRCLLAAGGGARGLGGVALPVALSRRELGRFVPRSLGLALLAGTLDVAGNAFFVLAAQAGRLDIAAILSSMYPASTVLLASLLLSERVTRAQMAGVVVVLVSIALIAV